MIAREQREGWMKRLGSSRMRACRAFGKTGLLALLITACQDASLGDPQLAQRLATVTQTQCKQWDDGMLALFTIAMAICLGASAALAPFLGVLGRRFWFFTAPKRRTIVVSVVLLVLAILTVPLGPWTVGLGWGWLGNIDPYYFGCTAKAFGAEGLLFGLISPGQAAISQWPMMIVLLIVAAGVGCLVGIGIQALLARFLGIRRRLAGGEE